MTLIELLVSVLVIGSIATVLAATLTVTFRQQGDTQGRLDVARWGQSLAMWLPTDIASAFGVSVERLDAPCGSAECKFGSNALQLTWNDGTGETIVSYRYGRANDGVSFILTRVECKGGTCTSRVVLRDLSGPIDDDGNPLPWNPGDPVPTEVINVTVPLEVDATTPGPTVPVGSTTAQRVIVNVNGVPGPDGVNRGSSVSFTAGGSSFDTLDPTTYERPEFLDAHSGCGGPVTLIVDRSGSIGGEMGNVRTGVRSFVKAFEGTPTKLQIVTFSSTASTLGAGGGWNRFFDLAEPADVDTLIGVDGNSGLVSSISSNGATNWEDAFYRTWYASNGATYGDFGDPNAPTPELVVFFTDGVPTYDRLTARSDSNSTTQPVITNGTEYSFTTATSDGSGYGSSYSPRGWRRADHITEKILAHDPPVNLIGVGVGPAFVQQTKVYRNGWPGPTTNPTWIPNRVFLGDLVVNKHPYAHGTSLSGGALTREYVAGAPGNGWGDVSQADVLVTSDFTQFGSALTAIALVDCGGTLTVQTRDQAGAPADADITYQVGTETVTTSRIAKAGTFDIPLDGVASKEIQLIPQPFASTGYTAQSWVCRAGGLDLTAADYHQIVPGDPMSGIAVTVRANAAVSCTLRVTP
jgi:hypothetical protein